MSIQSRQASLTGLSSCAATQSLTFVNAQGKVMPKYQLIEASVCDLYFAPGRQVNLAWLNSCIAV